MNPAAREKLCGIVRKYGRGVCDEPRRCKEATLADLCPEPEAASATPSSLLA